MEFVAMVGIAIIVMIIFIGIAGELIFRNETDKKNIVFNDYGQYLLQEIIIAAESRDGYLRIIDIPDKIDSFYFEIDNGVNYLTLNTTGNTVSFLTPITIGHFIKGENIVENINGTVCINC
ncbi:MAG: hypothetical protein V1859_01255 [archaeon]